MTGVLTIVGLGPGDARHRTPAATEAIADAEAVYGYAAYIDACEDILRADQLVVRGRMTEESLRAEQAVEAAAAGRRVVLVSSGDAGVYGMATLALSNACEIEENARPEVRVLPGVTAALAASALVGAPLAHDFACLTLSDLLTPWDEVERRLRHREARILVVETSSRGEYASTRRFYEMRGYQSAARVADFYAPGDHRVIYTKRFAGSAVSTSPQ